MQQLAAQRLSRRVGWRYEATMVRTVAVVALLWCVVAVGGCTTGLLHGLDESSANEALTALSRAGIAAEKTAVEAGQGVGFGVRVARGDAARALDVLRAQGLPRGRRQGFAEVYGKSSLIPTPSEDRARYLEALAGEIERTLETAEGVVTARVHLVPEETDPMALDGRPKTSARAAVLIKAAGGRTPLAEPDIQKLVAGSVPGLEAKAVAVVVTPAPEWQASGAGPLASVGPIRVTPSSRPLLVTTFGVGLGIIALLGALLLIALRRR